MRTGNNTTAPQWLYILCNLPYFWIVKVGIGGSLKKRTRQVGKSAPGIDIVIFPVWVICAYQLEQAIHSACRVFRANLGARWGTGYTERFYLPALPVALVMAAGWFVLCWGSVGLLVWVLIQKL